MSGGSTRRRARQSVHVRTQDADSAHNSPVVHPQPRDGRLASLENPRARIVLEAQRGALVEVDRLLDADDRIVAILDGHERGTPPAPAREFTAAPCARPAKRARGMMRGKRGPRQERSARNPALTAEWRARMTLGQGTRRSRCPPTGRTLQPEMWASRVITRWNSRRDNQPCSLTRTGPAAARNAVRCNRLFGGDCHVRPCQRSRLFFMSARRAT